MPKTLIFDFDGTIADTMAVVMEIANEMMPEIGHQPITDEDIAKMRKMTIPQGFKYLKVPFYKLPQLAVKARQKMKSRIKKLPIIDGMEEVLRQLRDKHVEMGIVTSNSAENVASFLRRYKMKDFFSFVDGGSNPFSKSRRLRSAIKRHNLAIEDCLYVGDEIRDIEAAKSIGLAVAAVGWGVNHPDVLKAEEPDYFVRKPSQLVELSDSSP